MTSENPHVRTERFCCSPNALSLKRLESDAKNGDRTEWSTIQGTIGRVTSNRARLPLNCTTPSPHQVLLPINCVTNKMREYQSWNIY